MRLDQDERLFVDAKWVFDVLCQNFGETVTYGISCDSRKILLQFFDF